MESKEQLQIAALKDGTVIDHIPSEQLFKVVSLLKIDRLKAAVTIGYGLNSEKMGTKGILKIADKFFEEDEINRIALVAPCVKLSIIHNYEVVEKKLIHLPDELKGLTKCNNPNCITNNEPMETCFEVIDKDGIIIQCYYCEMRIRKEEIIMC
ncbi:MAG: aspartate carbamoyltransferase regulatory subunit [Candidatus Azobacteroides pseudotrichonymphae]|jgi:aspartate carbamoyltransferase regulatory subunit|uniref:Aspartate carbamoyltransferase regulatory chain n=1 Tax=Azobacteroides pseudotrichonymphae genomovar. CFP2 TaxID=511995 RepID=B6YRU2_AZOPC|nr:aspartate carbamoyltransferase regulatory subunit [Candidatus Azobacteroides pseudotrichonymphae genomovar. CFP2]GMO33178.1 MAG: aspartate carbamoyltransferase regulatory subunit [Candidatus Azobacteroides pseudotrichonymphae]